MGGKSGSNARAPTAIGALQFQTSQRGGVIPLVYGRTRTSPNLIQYDDFQNHPVKAGGGKGKGGGAGKSGNATSYTYSASIVFALCQGPIAGLGAIWSNKNVGGVDPAIATLHTGADGQAVDTYWQSAHPATALGYSGVAYLSAANFNLGTSAAVPNISVEVISATSGTGPNAYDANPADIVTDFLTNPRYGAGLPSANLGDLTIYRTYCQAQRIGLSAQLDQQQEAQQHLADIAKISNSAIVWSGGTLKIIPYGDTPVTTGFANIQVPPSGGSASITFTNSGLAGLPITVTIASADMFNSAVPMVNAINANSVLRAAGITAVGSPYDPTFTVVLGFTATATVISASGGVTVGLTRVYSYIPNTTALYSLGEDDFIVQASGVGHGSGAVAGGTALRSGAGLVTGFTGDPVRIVRSTPADADNVIQAEYLERLDSYNTEIAEASDQGAIDAYGIRRQSPFKARVICDSTTAAIVAQLALQRSLYFRNTYSFQLGWKYCLLEPMDLVQITDSRLGLSAQTVRITAIDEDEEGTLSVTAEDFFGGYSTAVLYPKQLGSGYTPNYNTAPGPVNTPFIFEPPTGIATNQIWIALSGGINWGSATVWMSLDGGTSYAAIGSVGGQAAMGITTATLPSGSSTDVTNTLAVDLTQSRGTLTSVSASAAADLVTLSYLQGAAQAEWLGFQTATLTGANQYNLTTLYRGAYTTTIQSHASGSRYVLITGAVGRFPYPGNLVGQTAKFKFTSSNIVGGGTENLASVTAYSYAITGGP